VTELVDVHLVGIPLRLQEEATEHFAELMREFTHLAAGQEDTDHQDVPARLLALQAALDGRFVAFTQAQQDEMEAAIARGDGTLDQHYRLPAEAGTAAAELDAMLDEADAYCAAGDYLLTLTTPPGALAYRRWLLGQFADQAVGRPAVSWPDWAASHGV
jgi:hypothetical protein